MEPSQRLLRGPRCASPGTCDRLAMTLWGWQDTARVVSSFVLHDGTDLQLGRGQAPAPMGRPQPIHQFCGVTATQNQSTPKLPCLPRPPKPPQPAPTLPLLFPALHGLTLHPHSLTLLPAAPCDLQVVPSL
jgi:hypothetical protein